MAVILWFNLAFYGGGFKCFVCGEGGDSIHFVQRLFGYEGPLDALDHSSPLPRYGTRIGIDATRKGPGEGHNRPWPDPLVMDGEVEQLVTRRWKEYGL
jgi:3-polyprenyl-4-hydroxybenzoate decarboxylase